MICRRVAFVETQKSRAIFVSQYNYLFAKLHIYAGTTPVKLTTIFAMRFPHHKLHYETSNPISAFMETIAHAIQGELYVEA